SIGSTGSPLSAELFKWIYANIKPDIWLISLSGGTDVCSAFVGGCPLLPVYPGEIQCRMLGAKVERFDDNGNPLIDQPGEMVIARPMARMPMYFSNDTNNLGYAQRYLTRFDDVWHRGAWSAVTARGSGIIYGRSDAALNRHGVRIGPSQIYET